MTVVFRSEFYTNPNTITKHSATLSDAEKKHLKKHAVLFANGHFDEENLSIARVKAADLIIAVDGGLAHCIKLNIIPHEVVGDLDSADPKLFEILHERKALAKHTVTIIKKEEQDTSDLEYVLKNRIDWNRFDRVTVLGGLGGRPDHEQYNFSLITQFSGRVCLDSPKTLVFTIGDSAGTKQLAGKPIKKVEIPTFSGQTISIFTVGEKSTMLSENLKWPLDKYILSVDSPSLSNESTGEKVILRATNGISRIFVNHFDENKRKVSPQRERAKDATSQTASTSSSDDSADEKDPLSKSDIALTTTPNTEVKNPKKEAELRKSRPSSYSGTDSERSSEVGRDLKGSCGESSRDRKNKAAH